MKEFAMALWSMTAPHHQWPMPPLQPAGAILQVREQERTADAAEKQGTTSGLVSGAKCVTGKLLVDAKSGLYLPEMRGCNILTADSAVTNAQR
jgi:hypothetical protein